MTRLEQLRIDRGLTQTELARIAGLPSHVMIGRAERGQGCGVKTLAKLGKALDVPASSLLLDAIPHTPTTTNGEAAA